MANGAGVIERLAGGMMTGCFGWLMSLSIASTSLDVKKKRRLTSPIVEAIHN